MKSSAMANEAIASVWGYSQELRTYITLPLASTFFSKPWIPSEARKWSPSMVTAAINVRIKTESPNGSRDGDPT